MNSRRFHVVVSAALTAVSCTQLAIAQSLSPGATGNLTIRANGSYGPLDTIPDCSGAVGVDYFVELVNGRYSVYKKSNLDRVETAITQDTF